MEAGKALPALAAQAKTVLMAAFSPDFHYLLFLIFLLFGRITQIHFIKPYLL